MKVLINKNRLAASLFYASTLSISVGDCFRNNENNKNNKDSNPNTQTTLANVNNNIKKIITSLGAIEEKIKLSRDYTEEMFSKAVEGFTHLINGVNKSAINDLLTSAIASCKKTKEAAINTQEKNKERIIGIKASVNKLLSKSSKNAKKSDELKQALKGKNCCIIGGHLEKEAKAKKEMYKAIETAFNKIAKEGGYSTQVNGDCNKVVDACKEAQVKMTTILKNIAEMCKTANFNEAANSFNKAAEAAEKTAATEKEATEMEKKEIKS